MAKEVGGNRGVGPIVPGSSAPLGIPGFPVFQFFPHESRSFAGQMADAEDAWLEPPAEPSSWVCLECGGVGCVSDCSCREYNCKHAVACEDCGGEGLVRA